MVLAASLESSPPGDRIIALMTDSEIIERFRREWTDAWLEWKKAEEELASFARNKQTFTDEALRKVENNMEAVEARRLAKPPN
jgi:hypothetical protein